MKYNSFSQTTKNTSLIYKNIHLIVLEDLQFLIVNGVMEVKDFQSHENNRNYATYGNLKDLEKKKVYC